MSLKENCKYLSKLYKPSKHYYEMNIEELKSHILICKSLDKMSYNKIKRIEKFSPEKLQKKINNYLERQKQKRNRKNKTKKKKLSLDNDNQEIDNLETNKQNNTTINKQKTKLINKNVKKSKKISDLGKMIKRTIKKKVIKLKNNTTLKSREID